MSALELQKLVEKARSVTMTPRQREDQRRSFALGNSSFENDRITRADIDSEAERMSKDGDSKEQPSQ